MSTVPGTLSVLVVAALVAGVTLFLRTGQGLRAPGPRLSPDLPAALLTRAGFPVTANNVVAVAEWLAARFQAEVEDGTSAPGDAELAARIRVAAGAEHEGRAQRVLDAIAETDPAMAVRLISRAPAELLATASTGRGLLGGSVFEPLPMPASSSVGALIPAPRTSPIEAAGPAVHPVTGGPGLTGGQGLLSVTVAPVA